MATCISPWHCCSAFQISSEENEEEERFERQPPVPALRERCRQVVVVAFSSPPLSLCRSLQNFLVLLPSPLAAYFRRPLLHQLVQKTIALVYLLANPFPVPSFECCRLSIQRCCFRSPLRCFRSPLRGLLLFPLRCLHGLRGLSFFVVACGF